MRAPANRRVVITGIGLVTPVAVGTRETWQGLLDGRSGVGPITRFDATDYASQIAGEVGDFDPHVWVGRKDAKKMDRFIHLAIGASMMALEDAGLACPVADPNRTGVLIGAGMGGLESLFEAQQILTTRGPRRVSPFTIPRLIPNLAPGQVSILTGARGPNLCSVSACATGAHSIGDAARLIARGDADVMLAGGAEAAVTHLGIAGFAAMKALSTRNDDPQRASRPFDAERDGFVCAEGAATVILETLEGARARDARIYAEVKGYGQSSDGHHMTMPAPGGEGARRAMRAALDDAELGPEAVRYVNAHGTSTPGGDRAEVEAIRGVFGHHADALWVSSTKSMTGHTLGAAGAIESAVCALAVHEGRVPPTTNLTTPDPDCDLDFVTSGAREGAVDVAMNNSLGFGGTNVCLIFSRLEQGAA